MKLDKTKNYHTNILMNCSTKARPKNGVVRLLYCSKLKSLLFNFFLSLVEYFYEEQV